ncbi:MAG: CPBP family intramembrane metalloprotease [Archangiaceae bacterium]|nr:CPBP family intramembrane metalloprotease [Archangiaceae bacterium]
MSRDQRARANAGLVAFLLLSFSLTWAVAASLRALGLTGVPVERLGTRLFTTSLLYVLTMGWQPFVATLLVRRWVDPPDALDLGLRPTRGVFSLVGGVGAIAFVALAAMVAFVLGAASGASTPESEVLDADGLNALTLVLAFFGTIALVWLQAFAEELGWRGYFLPRAMERFGHWPGLLLHGAVWGLWYAPVLLFATEGPLEFASVLRPIAFVITCALLGTLYGWLRLASGSLAPVVVTNTTLTLAAGLPYVIHGVDPGLRSAAFGASGWLVLAVTIAALASTRWRSAVRLPLALSESKATTAGFPMRRSPGKQYLH